MSVNPRAEEGEIKITIHLAGEKDACELSFAFEPAVAHVLKGTGAPLKLIRSVSHIAESVESELIRLIGAICEERGVKG